MRNRIPTRCGACKKAGCMCGMGPEPLAPFHGYRIKKVCKGCKYVRCRCLNAKKLREELAGRILAMQREIIYSGTGSIIAREVALMNSTLAMMQGMVSATEAAHSCKNCLSPVVHCICDE